MQVNSAWLKPPPQVGGLDHLAVQAPCTNIYARMLPGITNVTDRARYYSFYPWLIWAFDRAGHTSFDDSFIEKFRRADCLFCLIAHRHSQVELETPSDDHAAAMVGSETLAGVAKSLGKSGSLRLSDYSLREGAKKCYFANRLGGLGQYYLGVLRELAVLDGDTGTGIRYSKQIGQVIAESMDTGVNRELFMKAVDADRVTAAQLDALHDFCPCGVSSGSREQTILGELFFARGLFYDSEALPRRRSLQLIVHLAEALENVGEKATEGNFRACTYSNVLPGGAPWKYPATLLATRERWAIYARNELLSIAAQGLFFALLDAYEASGLRLQASAAVVDWFLTQPEARAALREIGGRRTFTQCSNGSASWLPRLPDWREQSHEIQMAERIVVLTRNQRSPKNRESIVAASLQILIALTSRSDKGSNHYADFVFDAGYFKYYPINLHSLAFLGTNTWADLRMREVLRWLLINWGIENHLRVALRKLRGQLQSTFRLRPSDRGMEVIEVPEAVHTRPRFNQALRVLKDIGALKRDSSGNWRPSSFGTTMIEIGDAP